MSEENKDLLRYATEYADKQVDLYDLLGVDALTPKEDIHRAWRKRSLKYHPDKAGANFDAAKWELFERARDVLSDETARTAYDAAMKAKLLRKQEREAMDKERKKFADDLEARENAARQQQQAKDQNQREMMQKERDRLAELQRIRDEEIKRQAQAAQEMDDLAEARRRMQEKREEKARKKQAKAAMKASSLASKPSGPSNGSITVPGEFVADLGSEKKKYWELVCDKLRAVQAVKNLQSADTSPEALQAAEQGVLDARHRIHEAELLFQRQAAAS